MQFAKYFSLALAVAMPALALPVADNTVGRIELAGRSYLIVHAIEDEGAVEKRSAGSVELDGRSYLIVHAIEDEGAVEKRGVENDILISEDGTRFRVVPETV